MSSSRLFFSLLTLVAALATETAGAVEPVDMVRTLSTLQSHMVLGNVAARNAASKQIERIEQALLGVAPEAWKDAKNARAAAIYLLSGGSSLTIRKFLDAQLFSQDDNALISGSLAYAEGRSREAFKLLQPIDPRTLSSTLGGHLALVQGELLLGTDNPRALDLLDFARLSMPGSFVEEIALRREIPAIDGVRDPEKLLLLGRRYVAQYSRSPFARNFWAEFSASIMRIALDIDERLLVQLEEQLRDMNPSTKFEIYLEIARRAILNTRIGVAMIETNKAEPFTETAAARNRLKLYNALIRIISGNFEDGAVELQLIDPKSLSRADLEMRDIVAAVTRRLQASAEVDASKPEHVPTSPVRESDETVAAESQIEGSARQALADADALLQKASRQ